MHKQLYEEALADVKKVKQVAEDNAKRAVLETVTPMIREFIDRALLNEHMDDDSMAPGAPPLDGELLTDLTDADPQAAVTLKNAGPAAAITPPDADGKVTLDIDALCSDEAGAPVPPPMFGTTVPDGDNEEYEISLESVDVLKPIINANKKKMSLDDSIAQLSEQVASLKKIKSTNRLNVGSNEQIAQMISRVEDMYDYVQEQVSDPAKKRSYETMLEGSFKDLNKFQESMTMSQKINKGQMNEADVTLKLTGLPDDVDLDTVGVDLITGEEDEEGGDEDMGGDDFGGDDDLDMGGQDAGQDQEGGEMQMETRKLSDDTIVEIDENMLRREIARMRNLREEKTGPETKAQSWGHGPDHFDSFGGGQDEGEPTDAEIVDKSTSPGALPLGEADEDLEEMQDSMDESDEMCEMEQAIDGPDHGGNDSMPSNKESRHAGESYAVTRQEGLRRLAFEKKLQERAKSRAAVLKKEAARSTGRRLAEVKKEYALVAKRFNESLVRTKKVSQTVAEATQKLQEARSNSVAARPAENKAVDSLRKKLAETNLFNAKLLYTNKLLQFEQLTTRQKQQVIKQLDSAKTVREAKLVYESLVSTLAGTPSKTVNESKERAVLGSGSRATRPASTQTLSEGYEAERWAQLAGITKR